MPITVSSDEMTRSSYVAQSGAKAAWDQGYTGKGVTVAILDSGIAASLPEFSGRVHKDSGNFKEDSQDNVIKVQPVTDDQGHGTWVASVLGAGANSQQTVGIAPEANLLALGFYGKADMTGNTSMRVNMDRIATALATSRSAGASVVNGSISIDGDSATLRSMLQQSIAAGQLLVFSAGNEGLANPDLPARYAKESWAKGQIIAAGAVDAGNIITSYSNRAGDAMQFFLVARGDVLATGKDGKLSSVSGTSFSAPQIAGAAALIKQKWPKLAAGQIADVLFTSATDLGAPGVDAIYGRGLLNIAKAMEPIGQTTIATSGGSSMAVSSTGLALPAGGAASAVARAAAQGAFTVAATDSFGRDFQTNLAPRVSRAASLAASDMLQTVARDLDQVDRTIGGLRLSLSPSRLSEGDRSWLSAGSFFGYGEHGGWQFAAGSSDRLDRFFGLQNNAMGESNPYLSLARDGRFAATGLALSDNARVRAGTVQAPAASGQMINFAYNSRKPFQPLPEAGDWALGLTAGRLAERDRLLGMAGSGALAQAAGRSAFTTLESQYWLDAHTTLGSGITYGRTGSSGSGILQFSPVGIWSAEARIARTDAWLRGDRLSLAIGKPTVVAGGRMNLALPVRLSDDGTLGFRTSSIGLAGGASETRLGFAYSAPAGKSGKIGFSGMYRWNADNEIDRRESVLGMQYRRLF